MTPDSATAIINLPRRQLLRIALATAAGASLPTRLPATAKTPEFRFVSIGDWGRNAHDDQQLVADAIGRTAENLGSSHTLSVGDNFYDDGVDSLADPQWKTSFEDVYTAPSLRTPWRVILGNHDYRGNVQAQLDYHAQDARWQLPSRYYQITDQLPDGTACDTFYIDTNPFITRYRGTKVRIDGQDTTAQIAWLRRALATSRAAWKIVVGHHPLYTAGGGKTDEPELIAAIKPLLRQHGVRVYLNGHVHNLQHINVDGIDYITNGAGSRIEGDAAARPGGHTFLQHGFTTVRLTGEMLRFAFVGTDGKEIYAAALPRAAG